MSANANIACIPPYTLISTKNGNTPISEITTNDYVLDVNGNFSRVQSTINTNYDGDVICFKMFGNNIKVKVTPNHFIYVDRNDCKQFIRACEIRQNDKLLYPIYQDIINNIKSIKLSEYIDKYKLLFIDNEEYIVPYNSHRILTNKQAEELKALKGWSGEIPLFIKKYGISKVTASRIRNNKNYKQKGKYRPIVVIKNNIEINENFMEFLGYYLSEGNVSNDYDRIKICNTDIKIINRLTYLSKKVFGIEPSIRVSRSHKLRKDGSLEKDTYHSRIYSTNLAMFWANKFGRLDNERKIWNKLMYMNKNRYIPLIKSYFWGDGYYQKNLKDKLFIDSVSNILPYQLKDIMMRFGCYASINKYDRKERNHQIYYKFSVSGNNARIYKKILGLKIITPNMDNDNRKYLYTKDSYGYAKIMSISTQRYTGKIYAIKSENNTFCINHFAATSVE